MGDKGKRVRHNRVPNLGWIVFLAVWLGVGVYVFFFSGNQTLKDSLATIGLLIFMLALFLQAGRVRDKERQFYLALGTLLAILGISKINDAFIHANIPTWVSVFIYVVVVAVVIVTRWGADKVRTLSLQQLNQQKRLDQTKLEPLYTEQAKADKVKEQ